MPGDKVGDLPPKVETKLTELMSDFGTMNARELELRSTLLFLSHDFAGDKLVARLRELKPKYSDHEVRRAVTELQEKEFIQTA